KITANNGDGITQLAEIQMFGPAGPSCNPTTCAAQSKNCDNIPDGCGGTLNCGTCSSPNTCENDGTSNGCNTSTNMDYCAGVQTWNSETTYATAGTLVQQNSQLYKSNY